MQALFSTFIYEPILNLFVGLYDLIPDVGIVILLITIIVRGGLYPLTSKSITAQRSMTLLQPKMEELKKKYKDDQQKMAQETMKLYKEHKVNPLGSCLPLLIQLPIFLGLFYVLRDVLSTGVIPELYAFVPNPETVNPVSLGFIDLAGRSVVLAALAGIAQYVQVSMLTTKKPPAQAGAGAKDESMMAQMNKNMKIFMPIMIFVISLSFPAGLALYWFFSTALMIFQQLVLFKVKSEAKPEGVVDGKLVE